MIYLFRTAIALAVVFALAGTAGAYIHKAAGEITSAMGASGND